MTASSLAFRTASIEPAAVAGVDEVGRGPLAGDVVAAAVVLRGDEQLPGVRDSKQLTDLQRRALAPMIRDAAMGWSVGRASPAEIDARNIHQATLLAMQRALAGLAALPCTILVDGRHLPVVSNYSGSMTAVVRGDQQYMAIAAASILAKVARDDDMLALDSRYPAYGFARHKGYPTVAHREALMRIGPCPEHRLSFRPVKLAATRREVVE